MSNENTVWMVEQHSGYQFEPIEGGAFNSEDEADKALQSLVNDAGFAADNLRVVEYTGPRADAYRA